MYTIVFLSPTVFLFLSFRATNTILKHCKTSCKYRNFLAKKVAQLFAELARFVASSKAGLRNCFPNGIGNINKRMYLLVLKVKNYIFTPN